MWDTIKAAIESNERTLRFILIIGAIAVADSGHAKIPVDGHDGPRPADT